MKGGKEIRREVYMRTYERPVIEKVRLLFLTGIILIIYLALIGCQDLFQYSPHEVVVDERLKNLNAKSIEKISKINGQDTLRFVLIGDTQRFYDHAREFVERINGRRGISFVLLAGDISDFGLRKEFIWVHNELSKLNMPYVAVIGNHDILGNGTMIYEQMYGPLNFSFNCNGNKFICLNTNSREYNFNGSVPDLNWLSRELNDTAGLTNVFTVAHVAPFSGDFDEQLEIPFTDRLNQCEKMRISMYGHEHKYSLSEPYGDRVKYLVTGSMNKRNYVIVTVSGTKYEIESISF